MLIPSCALVRCCGLLVALFLLASSLSAQSQDGSLPLEERFWVASKIYSVVQCCFAHGEGAPGLDFDAAYRSYLHEIASTANRRAFDLATMALLSQLHNGHTGFYDEWLDKEYGQPLGFTLRRWAEGWVVIASARPELPPGTVITALDGAPINEFYARNEKYLEGSSLSARQRSFSGQGHLWPRAFTLTLGNGRTVKIQRGGSPLGKWQGFSLRETPVSAEVGYLRLPSFGDPQQEAQAVEQVRAWQNRKAMIIDVRGNGGGTTPSLLLRALLDRPWQEFRSTTPLSMGYTEAANQLKRTFAGQDFGAYTRGAMDAFEDFEGAQILFPGTRHAPDAQAYRGKLIVLTDSGCGSACDDFVQPLKSSGRAVIVGEATAGSSGQPYYYKFPNGMSFRVSAKRQSLPDGKPFGGVGIEPDIRLIPALTDLLTGRDIVRERALALAQQP